MSYIAGGLTDKEKVKFEFAEQNISFACALKYLRELGMTEFAAEQYLYAE